MNDHLRTSDLLGMRLARLDRFGLLDHVFAELAGGRGGWIITANLDFLRRHDRDPAMRELYDAADIRVADGMPLVWAARLRGEPVPERVAGSTLIWLLAERAAREGRSLYLLGGAEGAGEGAAAALMAHWPQLKIVAVSSPWVSSPATDAELMAISADLERTRPDLVLVGFGSPKQEHVIRALRRAHPETWMMGVGISFSFVAGTVSRAPSWAQATGLEWLHRLAQEPRRLARRYLVENLPFSFELFARALWDRRRPPEDPPR